MKVPKGFLISGINCGIKKTKLDLGLIYCSEPVKAFGVFTKNANPSYSVTLCKNNLKYPIKAVLVNSGNANCYSHKRGLADTKKIIEALAGKLSVKIKNILICSTGIIGKKLPKEKIITNLPKLIGALDRNTDVFAKSILTTDTFTKISSSQVKLAKGSGTILGFAKGAGMIYPNMATMLSFILTDIDIRDDVFKTIIKEALDKSFHSISIDACTSTNDSALFLSSKKTAAKSKKDIEEFSKKLKKVCLDLAKMIVRDAEGASKFIEIAVCGAKSKTEAKKGAMALANSNLFKTALYGANPNWGRIVAALGQVGIKVKEDFKVKASSLKKKKVKITIDLKEGKYRWSVYTSDLTPEYVKINAQYS